MLSTHTHAHTHFALQIYMKIIIGFGALIDTLRIHIHSRRILSFDSIRFVSIGFNARLIWKVTKIIIIRFEPRNSSTKWEGESIYVWSVVRSCASAQITKNIESVQCHRLHKLFCIKFFSRFSPFFLFYRFFLFLLFSFSYRILSFSSPLFFSRAHTHSGSGSCFLLSSLKCHFNTHTYIHKQIDYKIAKNTRLEWESERKKKERGGWGWEREKQQQQQKSRKTDEFAEWNNKKKTEKQNPTKPKFNIFIFLCLKGIHITTIAS